MTGNSPECPACASARTSICATAKDLEYRTSDDDFTFYDCADCGSVFLHPTPVGRLPEIYPPNYYSFAQPQDSLVHKMKNTLDKRHYVSLFKGLAGDSLAVLDVGGGVTGMNTTAGGAAAAGLNVVRWNYT